MPELPEVEIARRRVSPVLVGRRIDAVRLLDATLCAGTSGELEAAVMGRIVRRVDRRGKVLILVLDPPGSLLIHLKMTGQLIVLDPGAVMAAAGMLRTIEHLIRSGKPVDPAALADPDLPLTRPE